MEHFDYVIPHESNGNEPDDQTLMIVENDIPKDCNGNGDTASVESQDDELSAFSP